MFIQTEATPNPATLKFVPGQTVVTDGPFEFTSLESVAGRSPLAEKLFGVDGIVSVFFATDFITLTKSDEKNWDHLKPGILGVIMEHFMSHSPVMLQEGMSVDGDILEEVNDEGSQEIVAAIKELLDTRVRPAVAQDGGDITFQGFRNGHVYLRMRGACAGCPSSSATLQYGIQNLLKHFIPEVVAVEAI